MFVDLFLSLEVGKKKSSERNKKYYSICFSTEEVREKRIKGTKDGFYISWEPLSGDALGYVVDWCAHSRDRHCDLQWKKLGPNTTSTIITSGENSALLLAYPPCSQLNSDFYSNL